MDTSHLTEKPTSSWSLTSRITLLFLFIYLILVITPAPFSLLLPWWKYDILSMYNNLWLAPVSWIGKLILAPGYELPPNNGPGDGLYHYLQILVMACIAFLVAVLWTITDQRARTNYDTIQRWFITFLRYSLGFYMMGYGFIKFVEMQFSFPSFGALARTYGDSSPMGLLWRFMGYSKAYCIFSGIVEYLGGFLLLFRRTTTLGALIAVAVIGNIVMLNYTYDVGLKIISSHLLLMAFIILFPQVKRLVNFFILNKPAPTEDIRPVYSTPQMRKGYYIVKGIVVFAFIFNVAWHDINWHLKDIDPASESSLQGIYEVETFILGSDTFPVLSTDTIRWKKLIVNKKYTGSIEYMSGKRIGGAFSEDTLSHQLKLVKADSTLTIQLNYAPHEKGLKAKGLYGMDSVHMILRKKTPEEILLVSRGFHWVIENAVLY